MCENNFESIDSPADLTNDVTGIVCMSTVKDLCSSCDRPDLKIGSVIAFHVHKMPLSRTLGRIIRCLDIEVASPLPSAAHRRFGCKQATSRCVLLIISHGCHVQTLASPDSRVSEQYEFLTGEIEG